MTIVQDWRFEITYIELLDDGGSVVGDEQLVDVIDDDFVHAVRAKCRLDGLGELFAGANVAVHRFLETGKVLKHIETNGEMSESLRLRSIFNPLTMAPSFNICAKPGALGTCKAIVNVRFYRDGVRKAINEPENAVRARWPKRNGQ